MAAKMEKTKSPGIFKRGGRYVFSYRVGGVQKWESCRTLDEARRAKPARLTDIGRGEFEERSRVTLREYAEAWIERYLGIIIRVSGVRVPPPAHRRRPVFTGRRPFRATRGM
jgi:hypothetical protein